MARLLVTAGAGHIGGHCCVEFLETGHEVVVVDTLHNSTLVSLDRVREITGQPSPSRRWTSETRPP